MSGFAICCKQLELAHHADNWLFLSGGNGVTLADLRAINPHTQQTHIPHEVKAPWAEAFGGLDFPEPLLAAKRRMRIARPAAQILYYMVRPWTLRINLKHVMSCITVFALVYVKPCKHVLHLLWTDKSWQHSALSLTQADSRPGCV